MDESRSDGLRRYFFAERFLPRCSEAEFAASVARDGVAARKTSVILVQTIHVPDDETCFSLLMAPTAEAVSRFGEDSQLKFLRVLEAVAVSGGRRNGR